MAAGGNKAKQRQSSRHSGYYSAQFDRTARNKVRRAKRVERRKARWDGIPTPPKNAKRLAKRLAARQRKAATP